jgi:Myb-like DNA-binding domain
MYIVYIRSTAEDDMLRGLVEEHGSKKWSQIAMGLPGRSGKQCRERWLNHLDTRVTKVLRTYTYTYAYT